MITHHIKKDNETNISYITLTVGKHSATFVDFGARIHQWYTPDKNGSVDNILLSLDEPTDILIDTAQFGALVGPVAGRIKEGRWDDYQFEINQAPNHLHGGTNGWWHQFWDYTIEEQADSVQITFHLTDTLSGYPGPITVNNTYRLTENTLTMTTTCSTIEKTIVNPTNHMYFNLSGQAVEDITSHTLQIEATKRLETDQNTLPTGNILNLTNTPFDFSQPTLLSEALSKMENGIDDAFLLDNTQPNKHSIVLSHEASGREIAIETNRQSVVVFSTTGFNPPYKVNGQPMRSQLGIALETQELPDIVHHPAWGNIELTQENGIRQFETIYHVGLVKS